MICIIYWLINYYFPYYIILSQCMWVSTPLSGITQPWPPPTTKHLPCNENLGFTWMKQNTALSLRRVFGLRAVASARSKTRNISEKTPWVCQSRQNHRGPWPWIGRESLNNDHHDIVVTDSIIVRTWDTQDTIMRPGWGLLTTCPYLPRLHPVDHSPFFVILLCLITHVSLHT